MLFMQPNAPEQSSIWRFFAPLSDEATRLASQFQVKFDDFLVTSRLPSSLSSQFASTYIPLALLTIRQRQQGTFFLGINGAQGSGKSTLCDVLTWIFREVFGLNAAGMSLDDFYLTKKERAELAAEVHPLLQTRGVPGTHDTKLGIQTFEQLKGLQENQEATIPGFDKSIDDRAPASSWHRVTGPVDIVIFEGWCVGATEQPYASLETAVNALESEQDKDGLWRAYVNDKLAHEYRQWFGMLDFLVMLKVPDMSCVYRWRFNQEQALRQRMLEQGKDLSQLEIMDKEQVDRFIMHYERVTLNQLQELPKQAQVVISLNTSQQIAGVEGQRYA